MIGAVNGEMRRWLVVIRRPVTRASNGKVDGVRTCDQTLTRRSEWQAVFTALEITNAVEASKAR